MEPAWRRLRLTVNIATKLNRSHLLPGEISYILPVLGRIEMDEQATGLQSTSMEDSTGCIHGSRGVRKPASPHLISEIRLVAELAKASLPPNPHTPWDEWTNDYALIRKSIGETYPEIFFNYEARMWEPGGFQRPLPARHRHWKTASGRANFITPEALDEDPDMPGHGPDTLRMITLRSNDQFNTTVYGYDDRFRGITGTRDVLLMNPGDIAKLGLRAGGTARVETVSKDNILRELGGLTVVPYNIPPGCVGAYYPEANVLLPIWHHAVGSKTPAAKSIPVAVYEQEEKPSFLKKRSKKLL